MPIKDPDKRREYHKRYMRERWYPKNRQRHKDIVAARRQRIKEWFAGFKQTLSCVQCGENHPACLDFHHNDPKEKDLTISEIVNHSRSIENIKKEMAKCTVLCANCHRKHHWDMV